jgi:Beta-lactamase
METRVGDPRAPRRRPGAVHVRSSGARCRTPDGRHGWRGRCRPVRSDNPHCQLPVQADREESGRHERADGGMARGVVGGVDTDGWGDKTVLLSHGSPRDVKPALRKLGRAVEAFPFIVRRTSQSECGVVPGRRSVVCRDSPRRDRCKFRCRCPRAQRHPVNFPAPSVAHVFRLPPRSLGSGARPQTMCGRSALLKATHTPTQIDLYSRIGSVTKTFTVAAILPVVDKGKLGLNDPISKYIPGVRSSATGPSRSTSHRCRPRSCFSSTPTCK